MSVYLGDLELATGGGATGTGLPVNTYESFSVTATGNPTGYDATTGLYTAPSGDYWLKTGNTINIDKTTYPDATANLGSYTSLGTNTLAAFGGSNRWRRQAIAWNGTRLLQGAPKTSVGADQSLFAQYSPTQPYTQTSTNTRSGPSFIGGIPEIGVALSPDNNYAYGYFPVSSTTQFTVILGNTLGVTITGIVGNSAFAVDNSGNIYTGDGNIYDQTGTLTGTFPVPAVTAFNMAVGNDGYLYLFSTSRFLYRALISGLAAGFTQEVDFSGAPGGDEGYINQSNPNTIIITSGGSQTNNTQNVTTYTYTNAALGDATARTDSGSGQPLFIKIK